MSKCIGELTYKFKFEAGFSMWQALKIRVSGIFKNIETFDQVGEVTHITYTK